MWTTKAKYLLSPVAGMCLATSVFACDQDVPPIKITNDHVSVRFDRLGKPLDDALIMLYNRKLNVRAQIKTDKEGWVRFAKVPDGKYKLVLDGPSHESFEVVLDRSGNSPKYQSIFISFTAEYCAWIHLGRDPDLVDF